MTGSGAVTNHMTWGPEDNGFGAYYTARGVIDPHRIVAWVESLGGQARYEQPTGRLSNFGGSDFPRIVITGPDGKDLVMRPGDTVHDTGETFGVRECPRCGAREWSITRHEDHLSAQCASCGPLSASWDIGWAAAPYVGVRLFRVVQADEDCSCVPCTDPGNGGPTPGHCAACCGGSLIAEYDHDCPVAEHRKWAVRQFGPRDRVVQADEAEKSRVRREVAKLRTEFGADESSTT